jgi:hypothetical protein
MIAAIYAHREARRSTAQTARGISPGTAAAGSHRPPRPPNPDRREGARTAVRRLRCLTPACVRSPAIGAGLGGRDYRGRPRLVGGVSCRARITRPRASQRAHAP